MKSVNSIVDLKTNTELELSHGEKSTQVRDENEVNGVVIRTVIEIEKDKDEGKEGRDVENNNDINETSVENSETLFHRKIIRILPDDNGTVYSIEASVQGAYF
jgi:hypothetical protein